MGTCADIRLSKTFYFFFIHNKVILLSVALSLNVAGPSRPIFRPLHCTTVPNDANIFLSSSGQEVSTLKQSDALRSQDLRRDLQKFVQLLARAIVNCTDICTSTQVLPSKYDRYKGEHCANIFRASPRNASRGPRRSSRLRCRRYVRHASPKIGHCVEGSRVNDRPPSKKLEENFQLSFSIGTMM